MVVIGTSSLVAPASTLPFAGLESGAVVVEVNPDRTPLTAHTTASIQETASSGVPTLVDELVRRVGKEAS